MIAVNDLTRNDCDPVDAGSSIMMLMIAGDVRRKWLWTRCGGSGVTTGSHDHYDRLCLRQVDVDAASSVFSARPSSTAAAAAASATPDMM